MTQIKCLNCLNITKQSNKYCNKQCQNEYKYKTYIDLWLKGLKTGIKGHGVSYYIHRYIRETQGNKCRECGWARVNQTTGNIPIELDHINGKWNDNRLENLRLLCPSCHSLTPTFRGLNIGNGDPERYKNNRKKVIKEKNYIACFSCGIKLKTDITHLKSGLCQNCIKHKKRKFNPTKEELLELITTLPMTRVAEQFGVSDNGVRKRCKLLGIDLNMALNNHYRKRPAKLENKTRV